MQKPGMPKDEAARQASLVRLGVLDTPSEERFDRITRLAKRSLGTDIALVSLVDAERQWFKSAQGLAASETPRDVSFCGHAIHSDEPFVVPDASADERFSDNPLVTGDPAIRLYAGQPIHTPDGQRVGTLCVIDPVAREFAPVELDILRDLAALVENELRIDALGASERELRRRLGQAERRAAIDHLTRLWSRGAILDLLDLEIDRAKRAAAHVAVAMIDVDHFKRTNDDYGHVVGDRILAAVAERIRGALRPYDAVGRYGGEEFIAVIVEADATIATQVGDRIRRCVKDVPINHAGNALEVTVSVGVCSRSASAGHTATELIDAADRALYAAKKAGRDRVESAPADDADHDS